MRTHAPSKKTGDPGDAFEIHLEIAPDLEDRRLAVFDVDVTAAAAHLLGEHPGLDPPLAAVVLEIPGGKVEPSQHLGFDHRLGNLGDLGFGLPAVHQLGSIAFVLSLIDPDALDVWQMGGQLGQTIAIGPKNQVTRKGDTRISFKLHR